MLYLLLLLVFWVGVLFPVALLALDRRQARMGIPLLSTTAAISTF